MRTFLALDVPGDITAYLKGVIDRLAKRTEGVRWVRNEGIHITVKFLGEIAESMVLPMQEALAPISGLHAPHRRPARATRRLPQQKERAGHRGGPAGRDRGDAGRIRGY